MSYDGCATYPPCPQRIYANIKRAALAPPQFRFAKLNGGEVGRIYLVLLRGEIASFHPPAIELWRGTRLCGSPPQLYQVKLFVGAPELDSRERICGGILPFRGMGVTHSAAHWSPDFPPRLTNDEAAIRLTSFE